MDMTRPFSVLCDSVDADVLAVLARTTRDLTGRDVARLADRSPQAVIVVLHRLAGQGIVEETSAGRSLLFKLNREHLAAPAVELLANLRSLLFDRVRSAVQSWELEPKHVSVFGSAVRGDGDTTSDIDLFVVRPRAVAEDDPAWRSQLDELARKIRIWSGNHAGVSEVGEEELPRLRRERPPVVSNLQHDAITIHGPAASELFKRSR
jgi:predicted nucleotidyltransferase